MRHAIRCLGIALCFAGLLLPAGRARAEAVQRIDGTGLIDYTHPPDFRVGTWVKYHVTGSSEGGASDDYTVTLVIAGEETFWGDDCFWVETWQEPLGRPPRVQASLVSYSIFDDTSSVPNVQLYLRKLIQSTREDGTPIESVPQPTRDFAKRRTPISDWRGWVVDTLGADSVTVPAGTFLCQQISLKQGVAATVDQGDSSIRRTVSDTRVRYVSSKVPVTSIVREDIENLAEEKVWRLGKSQDARNRIDDRATGSAVLVDYGDGMAPQVVPESVRKISGRRGGKSAAKRGTGKPTKRRPGG